MWKIQEANDRWEKNQKNGHHNYDKEREPKISFLKQSDEVRNVVGTM